MAIICIFPDFVIYNGLIILNSGMFSKPIKQSDLWKDPVIFSIEHPCVSWYKNSNSFSESDDFYVSSKRHPAGS